MIAQPKQAPLKLKPAVKGRRAEDPKLEFEACRAADRIATRRPVDALSARPMAALPGYAGTGTALTATARARLEAGFGANLSGLRIHTGPAAHALTRSLNARAFAAGQHLVFAEGAFRPHEASGLRLIAHETAHALQQTAGEAQHAGQAAPQRAPEQPAPDFRSELFRSYTAVKTLGGKAYDPNDADYAADIAALQDVIKEKPLLLNKPTTTSTRLAAFILEKSVSRHPFRSFRGRCIAFDLMAFSGEFKSALTFLMGNLDIEQFAHNSKFSEYFNANADHKTLAKLFLDEGKSSFVRRSWVGFQNRFSKYMLDPRTTLPNESPIFKTLPDTKGHLKLNYAQGFILGSMIEQERHLLKAMKEEEYFDFILNQFGLDAATTLKDTPYIGYLNRLGPLFNITHPSEKTKANPETQTIKTGVEENFSEFGARLAARYGETAKKIYEGAKEALGVATSLAQATSANLTVNNILKQKKVAKVSEINSYFNVVSKALAAKDGAGVFALVSEKTAGVAGMSDQSRTPMERQAAFLARLPSPKAFGIRRKEFIKNLQANRVAMARRLAKADVRSTPKEGKILDTRNTLLAALVWSDWAIRWMGKQTVEPTSEGVALARFQIANALGLGAYQFGQAGLVAKVKAVFAAKEFGLSYAIIPKGFKKKAGADFSKLRDEAEWIQVVSNTGMAAPEVESLAMSTQNLVRFFQFTQTLAEIEVLKQEIALLEPAVDKRLLQTPEQEFKDRKISESDARARRQSAVSLDDKLKSARDAVPVPELYEAAGGIFVIDPKDKTSTADIIQTRHPSMPALFGSADAPTSDAPIFKGKFVFRTHKDNGSVYFWALRGGDLVWAELLNIPELKPLMDMFLAAETLSGLSAWGKMLRLQIWAKKMAKGKKLSAMLARHFSAKQKAANAEMITQLRALTRVNRKIARDNLIDFLTNVEGKLEAIFLPKMFGEMLSSFVQVVQPREDRDMQLATLLLETVGEIEKVVDKHPNYDAISYLLPPVTLAVSLIRGDSVAGVRIAEDLGKNEKKAKSKANLGNLAIFDPAFTDLDARYAQLQRVMKKLLRARAKSQETWTLYADKNQGMHTELSAKNIKPKGPYSAFILALWSSKDATNKSEGNWRWGEKLGAAASPDATANPALKPREKLPSKTIRGTRSPIFYRIDKIHKTFDFVPPFNKAALSTAKVKNPNDPSATGPLGGFSATDVLVTISVANTKKAADGTQTISRLRTVDIRAGDTQLLALLAAVIDTHSRNAQLQDVTKMINAGVELALDLAEFVPGYGQALMVARMVADIISLIASGELNDVKEDLIDIPLELVNTISSDFMAELNGSFLWKFLFSELFLGSGARTAMDALEKINAKHKIKQARQIMPPKKGAKSKKYKVLAKSLAGIGFVFIDALQSAQKKAGIGVNSAAGKMASSPILAPHIGRLDTYIEWSELAFVIAQEAAAIKESGENSDITSQIIAAQKGFSLKEFSESMSGMFAAIKQIELPDEVVPTELLIEVAIDFLLSKSRNKKVKFVYSLLKYSGATTKISDAISEHLMKGTNADPNKLWRDNVRSKINEPFKTGRDNLIITLKDYVNNLFKFINGTFDIKVPALATDQPATSGTTPQADGFNLPGDPRHPHPGALPDERGRPLSAPMRAMLETGFGYDLSHVRLHDSAEANEFVSRTGAEALASGSHIYLGEGMGENSPETDHILRHEVAHVLQQTTPPEAAPLANKDQRPSQGRPGRGVQFDPAREAAADQMAHAAQRNNADKDGPIAVRGIGPTALAPKFNKADIKGALLALKGKVGAGHYTENLLAGGLKLNKTSAKTALEEATQLRKDLRTKLDSAKWKGNASFSSGTRIILVRAEAKDSVSIAEKKTRKGQLTADADALVARAVSTLSVRELKRTGRTKDIYQLNSRAYMNILTGYIYEQSGIRLDIKFGKTKPYKITEVEILGVHIGRLRLRGKNNPLFDKIAADNPDAGDFKFKHARIYYRGHFPERQRWDTVTGQFRIHKNDRKIIIDAFKSARSLAPANLPEWKDYSETDGGGLGLRVNLHGVLTKKDKSGPKVDNTGRESHHLPQFLLAEFYAGENDGKQINIFGKDGSYWTPGFVQKSSLEKKRPRTKRAYKGFGTGNQAIDFEKLSVNSNRGNTMPAVSLAASTHKTGNLHLPLSPVPNALDTNSSVTQGFTMVHKHRNALIEKVKPHKAQLIKNAPKTGGYDLGSAKGFKNVVDAGLKTPGGVNLLETATFEAMRANYAWMVGLMWGKLDTALDAQERVYYEFLASEKLGVGVNSLPDGGKYTPQKDNGWKTKIKAALKTKNQAQYGHWFVGGAW